MEFEKEDEDFYLTPESDSEYSSDDSDNDPTYSIIEETHAKFSKLSIKKKTKPRMVGDIDEEDSNGRDVVPPELDEIDEKSFEEIQRMIGAGQLEKLKVDQCKVYLRKNGLRLTGNKSTLLQRIKEHLEILNGGGEKKYPLSSFVLNCKGDACTGDVVLFEQKVYDMFNIASRSASGPPCGTRTVAGRIVKESYGTAKQQHTFTIEVLWSKGEKPLPPLHPLLIKGRNLYRLKTLRQKWEDEGERQKILLEKHSRGSLARSNREARIQEKGKRKLLRENRISIKESSRKQPQFDSTLVPKPVLQPQKLSLLVKSKNTEKQPIGPQQLGFSTDSEKLATNNAHQSSLTANNRKLATQPPARNSSLSVDCGKVTTQCQLEKNTIQHNYVYVNNHASQNLVGNRSSSKGERTYSDVHEVQHTSNRLHSNNRGSKSYLSDHGPPSYTFSSMNWTKELQNRGTHRPPLTSMNNYRPMSPSRSQNCMQQKLCRYYAQGRCYFGDSCKFSHDMREKCGQRREERWPHDPREFRGEHRSMFYDAHIDSHWS